MRLRLIIAALCLLLAVPLIGATVSEQYGAAAWRILKTMMGTGTCAEGSLCMWGGGTYYADSIAEAQDALDLGCGDDLTVAGTNLTGCHVMLTKALMDDGGETLHLAGTGTPQTGRAGVTLSGVGGGTATGDNGYATAGTILKASGSAHTSIDVGTCQGCVIENLTIAGEDISTAGIDLLDPTSNSYPTTRLVVRNVAMYEINGYGIRAPASGQVDTMLFENVSVRDSDGCYQQRDTQTIGAILTNFDCSLRGTASGPLFDIQKGDFSLLRSFVAIKHNETAIKIGTQVGRVLVDGNQIELGSASPAQGSDSAYVFDFDEGQTTTENNMTISNNHVVYGRNGNTLFDVQRKGTLTVFGNSWQDVTGGLTIASYIMVDESNSLNRLFFTSFGNMDAHNGSGGVNRPVRWLPTLEVNNDGIYPTLQIPIIASPVTPGDCMDGEVWVDWDAAAGSGSATKCLSNAWVAF